MVVERASLYGSRNIHDQHRDMRMDIDNMSYEVIINLLLFLGLQLVLCTLKFSYYFHDWHDQELLALGERIGHVNTGLSEDMFSKCLTETIYCSSEQSQDEGTCVICLVCFPSFIYNKQFRCIWMTLIRIIRCLIVFIENYRKSTRTWMMLGRLKHVDMTTM